MNSIYLFNSLFKRLVNVYNVFLKLNHPGRYPNLPDVEEGRVEEISYLDGTRDEPIDAKEAEKKVRSAIDIFSDKIVPTLDTLGPKYGKGKGNLGCEALKGLHDVYNIFLKLNYPDRFPNLPEIEEMRRGAPKAVQVRENELADIKKGQNSIRNLNEQRNQKLNDELMRRLLK